MSYSAIIVFTGRSIERMCQEGGSQAWSLDSRRARTAEYVVCVQNRHGDDRGGQEPHGTAFMVAPIHDVVPSPEWPGRWMLAFREFAEIHIRNAWGGWRNPVRYASLDQLGIDPRELKLRPVGELLTQRSGKDLGSDSDEKSLLASEPVVSAGAIRPLTIAEAKRGLAVAFGVSEDKIEITIRG
ncbi:MAG: hypothetical protein HQL40_09100 [Alphaproteobacteria bacterium]|nr:hypothetical protein [Alphaproteobacteria bacterium]